MKYIKILILVIITILATYFITIYNLQITQIKTTQQGTMITINGQNYYYDF